MIRYIISSWIICWILFADGAKNLISDVPDRFDCQFCHDSTKLYLSSSQEVEVLDIAGLILPIIDSATLETKDDAEKKIYFNSSFNYQAWMKENKGLIAVLISALALLLVSVGPLLNAHKKSERLRIISSNIGDSFGDTIDSRTIRWGEGCDQIKSDVVQVAAKSVGNGNILSFQKLLNSKVIEALGDSSPRSIYDNEHLLDSESLEDMKLSQKLSRYRRVSRSNSTIQLPEKDTKCLNLDSNSIDRNETESEIDTERIYPDLCKESTTKYANTVSVESSNSQVTKLLQELIDCKLALESKHAEIAHHANDLKVYEDELHKVKFDVKVKDYGIEKILINNRELRKILTHLHELIQPFRMKEEQELSNSDNATLPEPLPANELEYKNILKAMISYLQDWSPTPEATIKLSNSTMIKFINFQEKQDNSLQNEKEEDENGMLSGMMALDCPSFCDTTGTSDNSIDDTSPLHHDSSPIHVIPSGSRMNESPLSNRSQALSNTPGIDNIVSVTISNMEDDNLNIDDYLEDISKEKRILLLFSKLQLFKNEFKSLKESIQSHVSESQTKQVELNTFCFNLLEKIAASTHQKFSQESFLKEENDRNKKELQELSMENETLNMKQIELEAQLNRMKLMFENLQTKSIPSMKTGRRNSTGTLLKAGNHPDDVEVIEMDTSSDMDEYLNHSKLSHSNGNEPNDLSALLSWDSIYESRDDEYITPASYAEYDSKHNTRSIGSVWRRASPINNNHTILKKSIQQLSFSGGDSSRKIPMPNIIPIQIRKHFSSENSKMNNIDMSTFETPVRQIGTTQSPLPSGITSETSNNTPLNRASPTSLPSEIKSSHSKISHVTSSILLDNYKSPTIDEVDDSGNISGGESVHSKVSRSSRTSSVTTHTTKSRTLHGKSQSFKGNRSFSLRSKSVGKVVVNVPRIDAELTHHDKKIEAEPETEEMEMNSIVDKTRRGSKPTINSIDLKLSNELLVHHDTINGTKELNVVSIHNTLTEPTPHEPSLTLPELLLSHWNSLRSSSFDIMKSFSNSKHSMSIDSAMAYVAVSHVTPEHHPNIVQSSRDPDTKSSTSNSSNPKNRKPLGGKDVGNQFLTPVPSGMYAKRRSTTTMANIMAYHSNPLRGRRSSNASNVASHDKLNQEPIQINGSKPFGRGLEQKEGNLMQNEIKNRRLPRSRSEPRYKENLSERNHLTHENLKLDGNNPPRRRKKSNSFNDDKVKSMQHSHEMDSHLHNDWDVEATKFDTLRPLQFRRNISQHISSQMDGFVLSDSFLSQTSS